MPRLDSRKKSSPDHHPGKQKCPAANSRSGQVVFLSVREAGRFLPGIPFEAVSLSRLRHLDREGGIAASTVIDRE